MTGLVEEEILKQYVVKTKEDDKFLLLYVMIKLGLLTGKSLIFVLSKLHTPFILIPPMKIFPPNLLFSSDLFTV